MNTIPNIKDPKYLDWIRTCPCAFCGFQGPSEPHHVKGVDGLPGTGRKSSDYVALPACDLCHDGEQRYLTHRESAWLLKKIVCHLAEYIIARTKKGGPAYAERIMREGKT